MKKLLGLIILCSLFTGCASQPGSPSLGSKILCGYGVCTDEVKKWANDKLFNNAKQDCQRMGHKDNTPGFAQCVQTLVENERTRVANQNAANQIASQNAMNDSMTRNQMWMQQNQRSQNSGYRNYDCRSRIGGRVECTGY